MAAPLDLSVIVLSFQRPRQLELCLASLAAQQGVDGRFEVIVADDGSADETAAVVARHACRANHPVRFLTHEHRGIHRAYCRNEGIRAASAPYVLFIDDDCILPPRHLAEHLAASQPGVVRAGVCARFSEALSRQIDEPSIRDGSFVQHATKKTLRGVRRHRRKAVIHSLMGRTDRPKLLGYDFAAWRRDLLHVNGFDENYPRNGDEVGELALRLRSAGLRIASVVHRTHSYQLWSPPRPAAPAPRVMAGVVMGQRSLILPRCMEGVVSRSLGDIAVNVIAEPFEAGVVRQITRAFSAGCADPDIEVMLYPTTGRFSKARCPRIVVVQNEAPVPMAIRRAADMVVDLNGPRRGAAIIASMQRLLGLDARNVAAA